MGNPYEPPKANPASESANALAKLAKSPVVWLTVLLASPLLVALLLPFLQVAVWDGGYTLTVVVQPTTGLGKAPLFCPCGTREQAAIVEDPGFLPGEFVKGKLVRNNEFELYVRVSGRTTAWGHEYGRSQSANWLVVHSETDDGETHRKVFAVPDGRKQRTIVVDIP